MTEETVNRRNYVKYVGAGIVAVAVAGGAGYYASRGPTTSTTETTTSGTSIPVTLEVLTYDFTPAYGVKEHLDDFYNKTGIKVNITMLPWDSVHQKIVLEAANKSPSYDIFSNDCYVSQTLMPSDAFEPLEPYQNNPDLAPHIDLDALVPGIVEYYGIWNHQVVAVPSFHVCNILFAYRKDLFENEQERTAFKTKYGYDLQPPNTWDEYRDVCEFFTRESGEKLAGETLDNGFWGTTLGLGMGIAWDTLNDRYESFKAIKESKSPGAGWWLDDEYNVIFNNEKATKALTDIVEVTDAGYVHPGYLEKSWNDVCDDFRAGRTAITDMWIDGINTLDIPELSPKVAGKVGYFEIPMYEERRTLIAGWMSSINRYSTHKEEAYRFLQWLTSADVDKWLATETVNVRMPLRQETNFDPAIAAKSPVTAFSAKMYEYAIPIPLLPECDKLMTEVSVAVQNAVTHKETPKDALDAAASRVEGILKEAGYYK